MTFSSAVNSLAVGQAAKRPSWGGYVKRENSGSEPAEWASGVSYSVDDVVTRSSSVYVCRTAHTSGSSFDSSKFVLCSRGYALVFCERASDAKGGPVSHQYDFTPKATYGSLFYQVAGPDPLLTVDPQLMSALVADDWTVGSAVEFEAQRTGESLTW